MLRWKGREKDLIPFLMTQLTLHVHEAILSYSKTFLLFFPRIEENEEKTIYIYIFFFFPFQEMIISGFCLISHKGSGCFRWEGDVTIRILISLENI